MMRDEGMFLSGRKLTTPPRLFLGAAANPFADPFEIRVPRLAKKIACGAEFIQTQCIYNLDKFEEWMKGVRDRGLHEKTAIMAGLTFATVLTLVVIPAAYMIVPSKVHGEES